MAFNGYVLVIDDSITNQVLLEALLNEEGVRVETASSAKEAFQHISKEIPRVILLDILMPNVTGIEFLKTIRLEESIRNIPVFIITAANTQMYREQTRMLGATEFFPKPIDIPGLVKRVKEELSKI